MKKLIAISVLLLSFSSVFSWSNHAMGTWLSLYYIKAFAQSPFVKVESLEEFLNAESEGVSVLLEEQEKFFRANLADIYPPLPEKLKFRYDSQDLRLDFLRALRLNPNTRLGYYIQEMPGIPLTKPKFPKSDLTTFQNISYLDDDVFREVKIGSILSPLYVFTTAVDEPDYGMDVGLYEDNDTEFGKIYGFGIQPFGDPQYEYSSQAPFHMGFYYEGKLIYTLASFLGRTYPEMRAYQFFTLSRFAFKTGHEYWGYRFLGWGLHYIQDFTQPYHARVLPQYSTGKMIGINMLAMIGISGAKENAITRVSDRHNFIETYQNRGLRLRMEKRLSPEQDSWIKAFRSKSVDSIPEDIFSYLRGTVAKESVAKADLLDQKIENYASDLLGKKWKYSELPQNPEREEMDAVLDDLFQNFGSHTRTILSWARGKKFE
ncbi:MAG: phospholipase [Leptospira sp.]|nr:phospholipase [Leptospira sp.]